jgi:hypothetical protein
MIIKCTNISSQTTNLARSNDRYITFKALAVEPDYMQGPNPAQSTTYSANTYFPFPIFGASLLRIFHELTANSSDSLLSSD